MLDAKIWSWLAYSKTVTKKDSVVLLVAKTLSIRGSLYIWYSLQITLRLRGATPTNRHPLQSCGFLREILWHSCLEVVVNLPLRGSKQPYMDRLLKIFHLWVCSLYVISFTVRNWHGLYTNNLLNSYMVPSIITFTEAKFKTTTYYSTHFFIRLLLSALNRWRIS